MPLALAAAREALEDANLFPNDMSLEERRAIGVILGTGGGGLAFTEQQYEYWYIGPAYKASVYTIPSSTHGGLSSELSMAFGLRGLSHIISTGCTSSTDAIAYAAEHIALGRQEIMLTGGVDAPIAPGILAAFNLMTVLTSQWNDEPHRASRPFRGTVPALCSVKARGFMRLRSLNMRKSAERRFTRSSLVMERPATHTIGCVWKKPETSLHGPCAKLSRTRVAGPQEHRLCKPPWNVDDAERSYRNIGDQVSL